MDLSSKKVFITGIDGFTGFYLKNYLEDLKYEVFGSSFFKSFQKCFKVDLTKQDEVINAICEVEPDFVVHLAGIAFAQSSKDDIVKTNVLGSKNLFIALEKLKNKPKRVILASSAAVYGNGGANISEEMTPNPSSHYGQSKLEMEKLSLNFDQNFVITRPFNYTGKGQNENFIIPKLVYHFKNKLPEIKLGNIKVKREYNFVKDIVKIYAQLLDFELKDKIFNLGSSKVYSIEEIIEILSKISSHELNIVIDKDFVRQNDPAILSADISRLKQNNLSIPNTDIETILRQMLVD